MSRRNESYVPLLCDYPDSEKINKVSEGAEAMFCRLLAKCDDDGNYHGEPKRLLGKLFTLRYENGTMTVKKVEKYAKELIKANLIARYESGTVRYVHVIDCKKSLRKDVTKKVFYPEYVKTPQLLDNKEDNESVTARNEPVTPIQSNPIQSNKEYMSIFNEARKLFPGTKSGLQTEYSNFTYRCKRPVAGQLPFILAEVLPLLKPAVEAQIAWRQNANGEFRPPWKNLTTWINKRCWEQELSKSGSKATVAKLCFVDKEPAIEEMWRSGETKYICPECTALLKKASAPIHGHTGQPMSKDRLNFDTLEKMILTQRTKEQARTPKGKDPELVQADKVQEQRRKLGVK